MYKLAVVLVILGVIPCAAQLPFPRSAAERGNHLVPYVTSPQSVVDKMLALADLRPGEVVYDLGSGDGRVLITAAQRYNVKGVGVEISEPLVKGTNDRIKKLNLEDRVKVVQNDFLAVDLSKADVVFLYLDTITNDTLRPNLEKFLKPGARVISHDFMMRGWKPARVEQIEAFNRPHTIYIYEMPQRAK
jgi:cyclopropane fatty-acyl-phospholipid synthase-like methyltransferase